MHFIFTIVFILFKDKSSYENCFACIFGISCIASCFWPFLSLNFFKENIKLMAFLAIIGATSIAAVEFHNHGVISSTALGRIIAINVFGFLCCMTSMLHRHRKPRAARIFGTIGVAAAGLGLLLLVSVYFSSYYGWMILGVGSLAILVICVWAFRPWTELRSTFQSPKKKKKMLNRRKLGLSYGDLETAPTVSL